MCKIATFDIFQVPFCAFRSSTKSSSKQHKQHFKRLQDSIYEKILCFSSKARKILKFSGFVKNQEVGEKLPNRQNILRHFFIFQCSYPTSQARLVYYHHKLNIHKLSHELLDDLKLKIFGKERSLGKSQNRVHILPSSQSPFQE